MTYKLLILSSITLFFLLGCSTVAPDLSDGKNNVSDASAISGETVSIDESTYGNETEGNYNSSSDNFRSIYFAFGEYAISENMQINMNTNISVATQAAAQIKIEGNCDEFGTDEYNYALGLKRAKAVKDNMITQGIDKNKIILVSFGESSPVCMDPSDSCYDKNRRVDIRLIK